MRPAVERAARRALVAAALALLATPAAAQDAARGGPDDPLPRRPHLVGWVRPADGAGVVVGAVGEGSALARAGLRPGDVLRRVAGEAVEGMEDWARVSARLRPGDEIAVEAVRDGERVEGTAAVPVLPLEEHPGVEVSLHAVRVPAGYRVRVIRTAPRDASGPLPAVFLAPWLSCDSVESPFGPGGDGMMRLLHRLAGLRGWVTYRTDRPGVGDSEGPDCGSLGFQEELEAYRAAFRAMLDDPGVDPERVFVLGLSNGGGFAPLVTEGRPVAGYVSIGGWGRTWLEHMLEHERLRRGVLEGMPPGEVTEGLLQDALLPAKYGRSATFHRELQALNLAEAWAGVEAPVLVVRGEHDWIMTEADAAAIAEAAVRSREVTVREEPGMDHFLMLHPSMEASYSGAPGSYAQALEDGVVGWLWTVARVAGG